MELARCIRDHDLCLFCRKVGRKIRNPKSAIPNETTRYLTEDHLGTPRVITDSEGNVISPRDFMPFGEEIGAGVGARSSVATYQPTNDNVKQKFTGYQKDDETGLDFAEARMYENRHGRFTAVDPLLASGKSANPQTFNRFVYCVNSPLGCVDPTGLDGERRWYSTTNPDVLKEKCESRCSTFYQAFEESPGENWNEVSFENRSYHVISGSQIGTQYLYADGTFDGGSRAKWFDEWNSFTQATRDYCRIDPKCLGVRDPEFAVRSGDAMWSGAAIYNGFAGTYNLGAWGANQWTPTKNFVPNAPILSPDENTSDAGKFFYYGTNTALLVQGGANGIRSLWNLRYAASTSASTQSSTALIPRGVRITGHAVEQMTERNITKSMVEAGIRNGERFFDPKNKTINYVIRNGFVRGKDLLVGTNPFNGQVTTVIRGTNLVKSRFIPIQR